MTGDRFRILILNMVAHTLFCVFELFAWFYLLVFVKGSYSRVFWVRCWKRKDKIREIPFIACLSSCHFFTLYYLSIASCLTALSNCHVQIMCYGIDIFLLVLLINTLNYWDPVRCNWHVISLGLETYTLVIVTYFSKHVYLYSYMLLYMPRMCH